MSVLHFSVVNVAPVYEADTALDPPPPPPPWTYPHTYRWVRLNFKLPDSMFYSFSTGSSSMLVPEVRINVIPNHTVGIRRNSEYVQNQEETRRLPAYMSGGSILQANKSPLDYTFLLIGDGTSVTVTAEVVPSLLADPVKTWTFTAPSLQLQVIYRPISAEQEEALLKSL